MKCQKRTDTSTGCPAMDRWELKEAQRNQRERLSRVKSSIDMGAPKPQPHLTLYGRDYVAKKRATTEAAFADLKMIQAIARTMTRKQAVEERKGPVSLNADSRKADIYRIMNENHRLLDHIDNVQPFTDVQAMVEEHKTKKRYIINASHTMRLSGEYDDDIRRIRTEDKARREAQQRSTELRREQAKKSGTVSLPSLTTVSSVEPQVPPNARQGAQKKGSPAKGWAGESSAYDLRRGVTKQQAKAPKPREPGTAPLSKATEPAATQSAPKPAVRFTGGGGASSSSSSARSPGSMGSRTPPAALSRDIEVDADDLTPRQKAARRKGTPHPSKICRMPSDIESDPSENGGDAIEGATSLEQAALIAQVEEDGIVVEDDCVPDPPPPDITAPAPQLGDEPPEAAEPNDKAAPEEYEDDFDAPPDEQAPLKAAPRALEEPPEDSYEEPSSTLQGASREEVDDAPAEEAPGGGGLEGGDSVEAPTASEPDAQEPFSVPGGPTPEPAMEEDEDKEAYDDDEFDDKDEEEDDDFEESKESAQKEEDTSMSKAAGEDSGAYDEPFDSSKEETSAEPQDDAEPKEVEPTVDPTEEVGVSVPEHGVHGSGLVDIAQTAKHDTGGEDQHEDEYEDEYEDDFVNEGALTKAKDDGLESFEEKSATFEESQ